MEGATDKGRRDVPPEYYDVTYKDTYSGSAGKFPAGLPEVKFSERLKEANGEKTELLEEIIRVLKRMLDLCLCCLTCGCYNRAKNGNLPVYEAELMDEERGAVQDLLNYLDSDKSKLPTINDARLKSLCILTYSDNVELQRSAALCFAEFSDRMKSPVSEIVLEPLVVLLRSRDAHVQKAASLAISNFALNGPESNKEALVRSGAIKPLVQLLQSDNVEVQCNTCGCITTLATSEKNKQSIVMCGGIKPLLSLAQSPDIRVRRNAAGALLNLTHLQSSRNELVREGALPVLIEVLQTSDHDVQYYCAAALSNMAVRERHRAMIVAIGHYEALRRLIVLMSSRNEKVKCQACLALRNLASDADTQVLIVKLDGLPCLHHVIETARGETLTAGLACLRNLSIHKQNEVGIIAETFLSELKRLVQESNNTATQAHAAGTIRNLAAGDQIQKISDSGCLESLIKVLLSKYTKPPVLVEVTAALAVLADIDENKERLLCYGEEEVLPRLIALAANAENSEIQYNCAGTVGQLTLTDIPVELLARCMWGLLSYLQSFVTSSDPGFCHIALWTCVQLLKYPTFCSEVKGHTLFAAIETTLTSHPGDAISELAETIVHRLLAQS